jgi:tetratricopeptide (TPR) repeat protein
MKELVLLALLLSPTCCFAQRYDADVPQDAALKDKLDQSISAFARAISSDPNKPTNYFQKGSAELQRSFFEKQPMEDRSNDPVFQHYRDAAIADFTRVIELQPTNSKAYDQRGLAKEDCVADFQADFEKAIVLDPKNASAYLHRGLNDGSFRPNSIDDFTVAIGIDPNCAAAYFYRAEAKQYVKNFDGTIEDLSKCISLNPQRVMPYQLRAYSEVEKGDLAAAESDWNKLTQLRPDDASMWEQLAAIKSRRNDRDGAISDLNRAIKLNPQRSLYLADRGDVERSQGRFQAALTDYRASLNQSDEYKEVTTIRFDIWECETLLGGRQTADKHLARYLKTLGSPWGDWYLKVGQFLLGQTDEKSLLASAPGDYQVKEAHYYITVKKKTDSAHTPISKFDAGPVLGNTVAERAGRI